MELTRREREQLVIEGTNLVQKAMGFEPGDKAYIEYHLVRAGSDVEQLFKFAKRGSQVEVEGPEEYNVREKNKFSVVKVALGMRR